MKTDDLLTDGFDRVRGIVHSVLCGLDQEQLALRLGGSANSVAWLVWHLTRVQDDHVADAAGTTQVWTDSGWTQRFDLPFDVTATGFGQSSDDVTALASTTSGLLLGYHDAVHERTVHHVRAWTDDDLDRIVDDAWDPPVTLGARLVSVIADDLQHAGQAAFVSGLA